MNLALHDIQHNRGRFILTAVGIGLLLMIVLGMSGIYRGMIVDALVLVDHMDADLWVVQRSTRGPFAEISRVPTNLEHRLRAVSGVQNARNFVLHTVQREHQGRPLRISVQGLAWPVDRGEWLTMVEGGPLTQPHYQMIADRSLGLILGEQVQLGRDIYTVVGVTKAMASSGGDGLAFFTVRDAQAIQFELQGEAIRAERQARYSRAQHDDIGRVQPALTERGLGPSEKIPAIASPMVSATLVKVAPGENPQAVANIINSWPDVTVHTAEDQRDLLLSGMIDKARRQLGLFRVILVVISTIIMALILYTLTLDKIHDIALLKLMGARNQVIVSLIMHQALFLGAIGYGIAYLLGLWIFPRFPRRVLVTGEELWALAVIVFVISVLSSLLGIVKAMRVEPNKVLS
jgi:putative ABC transport system permease protein